MRDDTRSDNTTDISTRLHEANRRLQQLRRAHSERHHEQSRYRSECGDALLAFITARRSQRPVSPYQQPSTFAPLRLALEAAENGELPDRENRAAEAVQPEPSEQRQAQLPEPAPQRQAAAANAEPDAAGRTACASDGVRAYPTLLAAILRHELSSAGRVWLLAQHIDHNGRGWLYLSDLRQALCERQSPLRICGKRRLRQILRQGSGIFWRRDDYGRIWLHATWRVCHKLRVRRLRGTPVLLPLQALCGNIADVRAAYFAAIHAGRKRGPISRRSLQDISGVPARTQRLYDKRANTKSHTNFAIGKQATRPNIEQHAQRHGRASFIYKDQRGRFGRKDTVYVARRIPNSYTAALPSATIGRKRKINRQLSQAETPATKPTATDLVKQVAQGNDRRGSRRLSMQRRYFADGRAAAKAVAARQPQIHWPAARTARATIWYDWSDGTGGSKLPV